MRPLLSALRRNPTGALLVALQVAITLAVLVNAAWIVNQRIEKIEQPTGIDTRDTFVIDVLGLSKRFKIAQAESEDLAYLRSLPDVVAATATLGAPLTLSGGDTDLARSPGADAPPCPPISWRWMSRD
ncbi:ABC transporter, permease protein [mine drainage metagenome]|uniref:ABC transporter, permease protein n=1 Tax=mine drainage metagenome TaxID=410659 RepID=T1A405_9ZZZZ